MTTAGSAPIAYWASNSAKQAATSPAITASNKSKIRLRSARPKRRRTVSPSSFSVASPACAKARSSKDRASRAEPSAARAIKPLASSPKATCSAAQTLSMSCAVSSSDRRRRSNRWHRDKTVTGTRRISVVAKINLTWGGGSSRVFNRPLKAAVESIWTSSII